jgi:hypothetical protein
MSQRPRVPSMPAAPRLCAILLALPLLAAAAEPPAGKAKPSAATPLQLETSTIKGHHELPRVLYIVPLKRAETGDLPGRPPGSLLDEGLMPIERAEFRRELRYSTQIVH